MQSEKIYEEIFDIIDREADGSDSLEVRGVSFCVYVSVRLAFGVYIESKLGE